MKQLASPLFVIMLLATSVAGQQPVPRRDSSKAGFVPEKVFREALVEEPPEIVSGPPLTYPDLLRQAGIQGRVIVRLIIDTMGRAEPGSVQIIQTPNPGFEQPTRDYVLAAQFRPARIRGRAVRVLVNIPIDFKVTPRR